MASTASYYANRMTIIVTSAQRDYFYNGAKKYGIGLSEFVRREVDKWQELEQQTKADRGR
jgi:hypothetical protein